MTKNETRTKQECTRTTELGSLSSQWVARHTPSGRTVYYTLPAASNTIPVTFGYPLVLPIAMNKEYVCPVCIIPILHEDKSIQCEGKCQRFFHAMECAKLSNTEYSRLANPRTNENLKWICRRADCNGTN
ncbi:hypothetical protein J6590_063656 [Homalodisca vitripennis]|nr:hypothetical protein J6590_063656 [Homalodisca vitripennis]